MTKTREEGLQVIAQLRKAHALADAISYAKTIGLEVTPGNVAWLRGLLTDLDSNLNHYDTSSPSGVIFAAILVYQCANLLRTEFGMDRVQEKGDGE